jgi:hypothetical protein
MITEKNRREFEELDVDDVKKRVANVTWDADKLRQAREWLKENDPAWISARAAQRSATTARRALWISALALLVAVAALFKDQWIPLLKKSLMG